MNLEELKQVDLTTLEDEKEHLENVLTLETEDLKEYLTYAIDTYFKTEEEGENSEVVERFFGEESFKTIYKEMKEDSEAETTETED